jgi:hypothetical protein
MKQMQMQLQPFGWPSFLYIPPAMPLPLPYRCPTTIDDSDISITVGSPGPPGPPGPPGSLIVPTRFVLSDAYIATSDDYFIGVDFNGPVTITLPVSVDGKVFIIKDISGAAAVNPITVTASTTIDGQASYILDSDYASITLVYNDVEWSIT